MDKELKHTPGPWFAKAHPDDPENTIAVFSTIHPICKVAMGWKETRGTDEANARLIAAAPELLEALEAVVAISDRKHDAWDNAKAAIAKAKGQPVSTIRCTLYGKVFDLAIKLGEYHDRSPAVQLIDVDNAEPFAVLSVCLPASALLGEGVFYVKHWTENEPVFEMMVRDGYIERVPGRPESSGFIDRIYAYRLTAKAKECIL